MDTNNLKLIYILKVGDNVKGEGIYEFIFSKAPDAVDLDHLNWGVFPANGNANPPTKEEYDLVLQLKTDYFSITCLHELNDRKYSDGYYNIHSIGFEDVEYENPYGFEYDDILVFQYRESYKEVENKLYKREVIKNPKADEFIHANKIKFKQEVAD